MSSFVLSAMVRILVPLLILFSWYLLWRGHNAPGGGFIGGLVAAAGFLLHGIAEGPEAVRRVVRIPPEGIAISGVGVALASGLVGAAQGAPFLTGVWAFLGADDGGKGLALGTPLLFDVGVYLTVVGAVITMVLAFEEEAEK